VSVGANRIVIRRRSTTVDLAELEELRQLADLRDPEARLRPLAFAIRQASGVAGSPSLFQMPPRLQADSVAPSSTPRPEPSHYSRKKSAIKPDPPYG